MSLPPPNSMRCVRKFGPRAEIDEVMQGYDAEGYMQDGDYTTFIRQTLMPPFTVGVLP